MEKSNYGLKELIINLLYYENSYSIADLSELIGKSIPSTTKVVNELIARSFIAEHGYARSTGGRRAAKYTINPNLNKFILSVAIDQHYSRAVVYNLANQECTPIFSTENHLDHADSFQNIVAIINQALGHRPFKQNEILGIGISLPGFVDNKQGTNGSFLDKNEQLYHIKREIENEFQLPTFIENDSTAIAIAEQNFGKAKTASHALIINMGWGVGLGIIVDNKLFRGHSGYAGEFSHIPLSESGKLCSCGKKGCLEVEASLSAAVERAEEMIKNGDKSPLKDLFVQDHLKKSETLIRLALEGDQLAIYTLNKSGYMLGKGIATLIHIMNPEKVILSGRGSRAGAILMPQIQTAINEFCIPKIAQKTTIEISELKNNAQLIGSACLVLEYSLHQFVNEV